MRVSSGTEIAGRHDITRRHPARLLEWPDPDPAAPPAPGAGVPA